MTVLRLTAEPVTDYTAELGEGPLWDANRNRVVWVDIPGQNILVTDPATGDTESISTPSWVGAVSLVDSGGYLAALADGVYLGDGSGTWKCLATIDADDDTMRTNDGKCDPHGSFVVGTIARDGREGAASLYRVNDRGRTERLLTGVSISNGLDWTVDGATMYYIDTPTRTVVAYPYDYASPTLGQPERVVEIPDGDGFPDGMTLDSDGCLWIGLWGGHAVHRYTPDGTLDTIIDVPVTNVTSCAFGGKDLDTLFVTTATDDSNDGDRTAEPLAGTLFAVSVNVTGRPTTPFRTTGE
ncbi:MAG: SMP-30/gluconolactonase/LRE family protein [Pirellulales bacterium]